MVEVLRLPLQRRQPSWSSSFSLFRRVKRKWFFARPHPDLLPPGRRYRAGAFLFYRLTIRPIQSCEFSRGRRTIPLPLNLPECARPRAQQRSDTSGLWKNPPPPDILTSLRPRTGALRFRGSMRENSIGRAVVSIAGFDWRRNCCVGSPQYARPRTNKKAFRQLNCGVMLENQCLIRIAWRHGVRNTQASGRDSAHPDRG